MTSFCLFIPICHFFHSSSSNHYYRQKEKVKLSQIYFNNSNIFYPKIKFEHLLRNSSGYSLIELLLVIALIIILGAATTPFLSNFIQRNTMETTKFRLVSFLRKAQANTMDGKLNVDWGVCISGTTLTLYADDCSSPIQSFTHDFPSSLSVTGFTDIKFSSPRGVPDTTPTITLTTDIDSQTITINAVGMIDP